MQSAVKHILQSASEAAERLLVSQDLQQETQHCLRLAASLIQAGRTSPDLMLAIAFLEQDENESPSVLTTRLVSLFTFLGLRLQFNDHYLQHLIAATFACSTLVLRAPEKLIAYRKLWQSRRLGVFLCLAKVAKVIPTASPERYLQETKLDDSQVWLLISLSLLRSNEKLLSDKLKAAVHRLSSKYYGHFNALLAYPGNTLPGEAVSLPNGNGFFLYRLSYDTAVVWFSDSGQIEEVAYRRLSSSTQARLTLSRWQALSNRVSQTLQPLVKQLLPQQYPVSRLPAELKNIIRGLQDADADIPQIAARIENIPVFATYLKDTASNDNRLQLAVRDVKQAMLTYGMTRVADMLILRALSQRLYQRHYPLLATSIRFSEVTASVAAELATHCKSNETPQTIALLATFMTAPIFTEATLKTTTQWPTGMGNLYDLNSLWRHKGASLSEMSTTLARQWQQPPRYQAVISHCSHFPADIPASLRCDACILGLSLSLARQWLFAETLDETTRHYQQHVFSLLKLAPDALECIQNQLAALLWLPLDQQP